MFLIKQQEETKKTKLITLEVEKTFMETFLIMSLVKIFKNMDMIILFLVFILFLSFYIISLTMILWI